MSKCVGKLCTLHLIIFSLLCITPRVNASLKLTEEVDKLKPDQVTLLECTVHVIQEYSSVFRKVILVNHYEPLVCNENVLSSSLFSPAIQLDRCSNLKTLQPRCANRANTRTFWLGDINWIYLDFALPFKMIEKTYLTVLVWFLFSLPTFLYKKNTGGWGAAFLLAAASNPRSYLQTNNFLLGPFYSYTLWL